MFRSYLLTLYRSITKHRLFSALNILGLAVGMAVFLVLTIATRFEFSYDRWIPNADRTYRVSGVMMIPGRPEEVVAPVAGPVLPDLRADFGDQIEAGVRVLQADLPVRRGEQSDYESLLFVDPTFFDVFDLPFAAGGGEAALADTSGIVISEAMARKYFGEERALGNRITVTTDGTLRDYTVRGVLRDLPENTHLKIDFVARLDRAVLPDRAEYLDVWNATNYVTYIRLPNQAAAESLQAAMPAFMQRRATGDVAEWMGLQLDPITQIHFATDQMGAFKPGSDQRVVVMLQIIGALTLLLAVINYVNLSTARSVLRAREVALRKVFGATRQALIAQFLVEAIVVSAVAGLIALAIVELTLPVVNSALGGGLELNYLGDGGILPLFLAIVAVVGLAAGSYPALVLSRFEPAGVLASARAPGGGRGAALIREVLVVAQFTVSIALLICTGVVFAQSDFVRKSDLGFQREGLIIVREAGNQQVAPQMNVIMDVMRRVPGVVSVTASGRSPGDAGLGRSQSFTRDGFEGENPSLAWEVVAPGYLETYGLRLLAGRNFSLSNRMDDMAGFEMDSPEFAARGLNILVNQATVRALQFRSPREAVGKVIRSPGESGLAMRIVGVIQDARYGSPRDPVPPIIYAHNSNLGADSHGNPAIGVRYRGDPQTIMAGLQSAWRGVVPLVPFKAETIEASMNTFYEPEERRTQLLTMGALVAVLIGCLGLYGLAAFSSERRTKEIGIRKVLGASSGDVVKLLVAQFLRPVVIANLIAWPLAFWAMREWLNGFDQHVGLSPLYFLGATALALAVALVTVLGQAFKVSRAEPGRALRTE